MPYAEERIVHGRSIAQGLVYGYTHFCDAPPRSRHKDAVAATHVSAEIERLEKAVQLVHDGLEHHARADHAASDEDLNRIIAAHILVLEDAHFFDSIRRLIRDEQLAAETALEQAFGDVVTRLSLSRDRYLRARAEDLRDICQSLQQALGDEFAADERVDKAQKDTIFVSTRMHPSTILQAERSGAVAFVTSSRAFSSHGVILLRASGMPSVCELSLPFEALREGTPLLVNAFRGEVIVNPSEQTTNEVFQRYLELEPIRHELVHDARTADGSVVELWGNIDNPERIARCHEQGLRGVGLFRTEFQALSQRRLPSEDQQVEVLRKTIAAMAGKPLVVRTYDFGGDKIVSSLDEGIGSNPALGVRGLRRHLLRQPLEFESQLRAILRASIDAPVSILLPMVTHSGEIQTVKDVIDKVQQQLTDAKIPHATQLRLGAMIEVPSAALNVGAILDVVDFISIGTNDLAQYLAAADRNNPAVASYLIPAHSGIFTLLRMILEVARQRKRTEDVYICGELASDPVAAAKLVGMGARALVIIPTAAAVIREELAKLDLRTEAAASL